jgi:hypothetical protein
MKKIAVILFLFSVSVLGIDGESVSQMLNDAVVTEGKDYIAARDIIISHGENVLPLLAKAAVDEKADWRYRLAARICYERIVLDSGISAIRSKDWIALAWAKVKPIERRPPPINEKYGGERPNVIEIDFTGMRIPPHTGLHTLIEQEFMEELEILGAWYYCIELTWKQTNEVATGSRSHAYDDGSLPAAWPRLCANAVRKQPEKLWLDRVLAEQVKSADFVGFNKYNYGRIYKILLEDREPEFVQILIDRFDEFMPTDVGNLQGKPIYAEFSVGYFKKIMSFADNRHATLIEKFIDNHPIYEPLRPRIEEIRSRPAPPQPDPREAFRLLDRQPIINDAQTLTLPTP